MLCKESVENTCTSLNPIPTMPIFCGPDCPGSLNFWKLRELIQPLKPSEYCPFVRSLMSNLDPPTNKSSKRRSRALSRRNKNSFEEGYLHLCIIYVLLLLIATFMSFCSPLALTVITIFWGYTSNTTLFVFMFNRLLLVKVWTMLDLFTSKINFPFFIPKLK